MDKNVKDTRDVLKIVEIILLLIVILLVIVLIGLEIMHNEYATYDRIYNYNAYRVTSSDDSVTVTLYHKDGDRIKTEETYYLEDGKITKDEIKYYFERISIAKEEYNAKATMIQDNLNSGLSQQLYLLSKHENSVIYTYLNPDISFDDYADTKLARTFTDNEKLKEYILQKVDEKYAQYYTKIK